MEGVVRPTNVGARVPRLEDARHLSGRGRYTSDIPSPPGTLEVAFVRSHLPHARVLDVEVTSIPAGCRILLASDLERVVNPIRSGSTNPNLLVTEQPCLAGETVRFVGEPVAMVLAPDRATAEDAVDSIRLRLEALPVVASAAAALADDAPILHGGWSSNVALQSDREAGPFQEQVAKATTAVRRQFSMARVQPFPMEGRALLAIPGSDAGQLTLYASSQRPHLLRSFICAQVPGLDESALRLIAPDVGGGFGPKGNLYPEDLAVVGASLLTGHPIRWTEDRWEHLVASYQAREHSYDVTAYVDDDARVLALEVDVVVDGGAYSTLPSTMAIDASMALSVLPGPYRIEGYKARGRSVATNKAALSPFRGVGRPNACFAMERIMDEIAYELGLSPLEVRRRNMITPDEMPYRTVTGLIYDSGDYAEALEIAAQAIEELASERMAPEPGVLRGVGYGCYVEQTAHGADEWYRRNMNYIYGHEVARATMNPDGTVTLYVASHSHGQGHQTSFAQIAADRLGLDHDQVEIRYGDTHESPFGMGTFASRSLVMAGGAVHTAAGLLADRLREIAASWMECRPSDVELRNGKAETADTAVALSEIAFAAHLDPGRLPEGAEPGLDFTGYYRPAVGTGAFSYATHAAHVEVDTCTGHVRILDLVVAEDCGTVVNPLIVDGQIQGGAAQGIGQALFEEAGYDAAGQPTAAALTDYLLPGAAEVPSVDIHHLNHPSPHTYNGAKGAGEGGTIASPVAIANAVRDALGSGAPVDDLPLRAQSLWECLQANARLRAVDR